jgi:glycosyltransferase involved in cell wall biosynthesis
MSCDEEAVALTMSSTIQYPAMVFQNWCKGNEFVSDRIKFNVIIPTRERADTLYHCLKTVAEQDYPNLQIIVSDNCSQDNTREVVASFSDPRIQYINTGKRLSMSKNWEFALNHVKEGWVTFLGDDDGMLPGAISRIAQIIAETNVMAIVSRWEFYFWPGIPQLENQMKIPISSGYEVRNGKKWLAKMMKGEADYQDLPWLYTGGFADINLIQSARNERGDFFCSMAPDVYSAVALASTTEDYIMLHEPVCVMGVSHHSTGASGSGFGKSPDPAKKFYLENDIPYHSKLLTGEWVKSLSIIQYESYLQSIHLHKDTLKVSLGKQLAIALAKATEEYYPDLKKYCEQVALHNGIDLNQIVNSIHWWERIKWLFIFLKHALRPRLFVDTGKYNVKNVYGAVLLANVLFKFNSMDNYWGIFRFLTLIKKTGNLFFRELLSKQ